MNTPMKNHHLHPEGQFYGTATVGEKGQIVIPQEARKNMKLKRGDRLLVFGMDNDMLAVAKLSHIEKITSHLSKKLKMINEAAKNNK
ncbi:MAG: Transcriptional regulator, AbrB family [Candidatus Giovannonibacteria bacterium GW2011_GWA2_45_21]|uniref:Transcriptional regulator, AbrB family n=1 Tax=Candidatus Giovannonibacteria bacterium GW2011_GWA2_45_21 TaxID=1618649 RepID=A0A0G1M6R8_9BACT|nr:MAG: Transcriptional regulator, AbrB family [Candidatus Giovannonibacteria bacterium GW2011_GWA2_45_21]